MKKAVVGICIAITALAAVALVVIMIMGMRGHKIFNWGSNEMKIDAFVAGESVLLKEDSVQMGDIRSLEFAGDMAKVYIRGTNSDKMTVRQYSNRNLGTDEIFSLNKSGQHVFIDAESRTLRIGLFLVWSDDRIEIEVPNSWLGDVDLKTSSGGIKIQDKFEWGNINMKCSSGGINVEHELKGKDVSITVSSGGINLKDRIITESIYIKSTSGGIKTVDIEAVNRAEIECSSGGITLRGNLKADDVRIKCTSGGMETDFIEAGDFDISSSSGGVKISELNGKGHVKCSSGGIKIGLINPTGNVELKSSSGGIKAEVPKELRGSVIANASSGGVAITER